MHNLILFRALLLAVAVTFLMSNNFMNLETNVRASESNRETATIDENNPLLAEWIGDYGGIPPFDKIKIEQFKPALEAAMNENLAEIDKIASDRSAPTF